MYTSWHHSYIMYAQVAVPVLVYTCVSQSEVANSVSSVWAGAEGSVASQLIDEIADKLDMSPNFISG